MLLLTIILMAVYFSLRITGLKNIEKTRTVTYQVLGIAVIVFLIVCLLRNPFEHLAITPVQGIGLNPQLQSLWMAIHPPIVFSAYAFVVLAFALLLASLKTNKDLDSMRLFKASTYMAWLLLTIGIALGGVWAYAVLGWGGYWAWDPVETASLLPWLILTAYFIVKEISKGKTSLTQETMIMLTFASLVFLSALTRGGLTQSVHSYASSAIGPVMLSYAVAMMGYFFYLSKNKRKPLIKLEVDKKSLTARSSFVGFWALILIAAVCLAGLAFTNFAYSLWTYPFVVLFVIALAGFSLNEKTHYARQFLIVLVALVTGAILSLIGIASVNTLLTLTLPLLIVTLMGLVHKLVRTARTKKLFWQGLFGLAMIVLLLGVFLSAGAKTSATLEDVKVNSTYKALNLTIQINSIHLDNSTSKVYNAQAKAVISEYSIITADVTVHDDKTSYRGNISASFYPNYGLMLKPLIISTTSGDIYLHLEFTDELYNSLTDTFSGTSSLSDTLSLTVQNNPLIYLVWLGIILLALAIFAQLIKDVALTKPTIDQSVIQK